jgi:hypothetical protein
MAQVAVIKPVNRTPAFVNGQGMTEVVHRTPQIVKSDVISFGDTAAISVFELPGNILVTDAWLRVIADFDGSGTSAAPSATFSVPVATGAQIILDAAALSLVTTLGAVATGPVAVVPASGGFGIVNYTPGTTTAGSFEVYMSYVDLADRL